MRIDRATIDDMPDWIAMRRALWGDAPHEQEARTALNAPDRFLTLIARQDDGSAIGFAEAALREDYVNGCDTSPVVFVEGLYAMPSHRGHGVARTLVAAIEAWARTRGCAELASDADIDNSVSHTMHHALGFEETERVVFFRKSLG